MITNTIVPVAQPVTPVPKSKASKMSCDSVGVVPTQQIYVNNTGSNNLDDSCMTRQAPP